MLASYFMKMCKMLKELAGQTSVLRAVTFQGLTDNYRKHLHPRHIIFQCARVGNQAAECILGKAEVVVSDSLAGMVSSKSVHGSLATHFQQCPLLNISYCPPTEADLSSGKKLVVVVYNSLGWNRSYVIRLSVVSENIAVYDSSGKQVESQLLPIVKDSIALRNYYATAYTGKSPSSTPKFTVAFTASVPLLGFSTYTIQSTKKPASNFVKQPLYKHTRIGQGGVEVGTGNLKLIYSKSEGIAFTCISLAHKGHTNDAEVS